VVDALVLGVGDLVAQVEELLVELVRGEREDRAVGGALEDQDRDRRGNGRVVLSEDV
jgi:hypothetical protein